jgi:hypothetical protein
MRKLIQEVTHPLVDLGPVLDPAMHLEGILAHPAPQLFDGVKPGGRSRQPDRLDARGIGQGGQPVRRRVKVPVVLDHLDQLHLLGIGAIQAGIAWVHLLAAHDVASEVVPLSGQGLERADGAPLLLVVCLWGYGRFHSPGGRDLRPALIAALLQEQGYDRVRVPCGVAQTGSSPRIPVKRGSRREALLR